MISEMPTRRESEALTFSTFQEKNTSSFISGVQQVKILVMYLN